MLEGWNLRFRRNLNDWEVDYFISLTLGLKGVTIIVNNIDARIWINESTSSFSYKSYFELLLGDPNILDFYHYVSVWKCHSPRKVKVLKWLIVLCKFNTMNWMHSKFSKLFLSPNSVFFAKEIQKTLTIYFYVVLLRLIVHLCYKVTWVLNVSGSCKSLLPENFNHRSDMRLKKLQCCGAVG